MFVTPKSILRMLRRKPQELSFFTPALKKCYCDGFDVDMTKEFRLKYINGVLSGNREEN